MSPKAWLSSYDDNVPCSLKPYPMCTLLKYLSTAAKNNPNHPALLFKSIILSYADLENQSDRIASILVALGLRKGDRIALLLPNSVHFVLLEIAAWKAGLIVVPINPNYSTTEIAELLKSVCVTLVVTLESLYLQIKQIQNLTDVKTILIIRYLLNSVYDPFEDTKDGKKIALSSEDYFLEDLVSDPSYNIVLPAGIDIQPTQPAIILSTSGTTGKPKRVMVTHEAFVITGLQLYSWFNSIIHDCREVIMLPLPLFHAYANIAVQSLSIISNNTLSIMLDPRDINEIIDNILNTKPSILVSVPAQLNAIVNNPLVSASKVSLKCIKLCISGSSPLETQIKRRLQERIGGILLEGYSLTEAVLACIIQPVHGKQIDGSVGLPLPDVEVKIVSLASQFKELGAGQVGEILLKAPQICINAMEKEFRMERPFQQGPDGDPWLITGDIGKLDNDGHLFIIDRKSHMADLGTHCVSLREIEKIILSHPAVHAITTTIFMDSDNQKHIKAYIISRYRVPAFEIQEFCRKNSEWHNSPDEIEFTYQLPVTKQIT